MAESYTGEAYCVKCKEKRDFTGEVKVSESGRRMAQGICPVCGTKLNRILGKVLTCRVPRSTAALWNWKNAVHTAAVAWLIMHPQVKPPCSGCGATRPPCSWGLIRLARSSSGA